MIRGEVDAALSRPRYGRRARRKVPRPGAAFSMLIRRGLRRPEFLIVDGAAGLENAIGAVWDGVPGLQDHRPDPIRGHRHPAPVAATVAGTPVDASPHPRPSSRSPHPR
jgi:hypothetical protein